MRKLAALLVAVASAACSESRGAAADEQAQPKSAPAAHAVGLTEVASGLDNPVHLAAPSGDPRLFIVEQAGRIRIVKDGRILDRPFLDISAKVRSGGEQGLLSVAFHPRYRETGFFFLNYTDLAGDTQIERYSVSRDGDVADPASGRIVLTIDQPYGNHNGGLSLFGPDGMLWIGTGDGGAGGDPHRHGQNPNSLLGKMLRINVDSGRTYSIPPDNPYARSGGRREVWAIGLRNPWRFAFDREAKTLYIADVGQHEREEINVVPAGAKRVNYGWNRMEGSQCYRNPVCDRRGLQMPVVTYGREGGACTVIGGSVYRGRSVPSLRGHYVYADYCAGWIRSFRWSGGAVSDHVTWDARPSGSVVSFGEDSAGEMYVLSHSGQVFRIVQR